MKLDNQTAYDTAALSRMVRSVDALYRRRYGYTTITRRKRLTVRVEYGRVRESSGGYVDPDNWVLRLPRPHPTAAEVARVLQGTQREVGPVTTENALQTILDLTRYSYTKRWVGPSLSLDGMRKIEAVYGEHVPLAPVVEKAHVSLPQQRYARAVALEKTWVRKHKLATTKLKQLRKRIKYYQAQGLQ